MSTSTPGALERSPMIEAHAPPDAVRRAYDLFSYFYGAIIAPFERKARLLGVERAGIGPRDKVLEVAVGPGATLVEILGRVDRDNLVYGVDLSPRMLSVARRRVARAGYGNVELRVADARSLPFADGTFDVLYNSYMLDLVPLAEMASFLREFRRVLRPGGRLVLVNLSKRNPRLRSWAERLYTRLPPSWVPYLMGSCRPVLMSGAVAQAGFAVGEREFVPGLLPAEVVAATKT
jgi:demethylmenaquinone methyltransferase/2-methoxy-6-polyprenyl-1,4-benzoquinol methylase